MLKLKGNRGTGRDHARQGRLAAAAALLTLALTACGGDDGGGAAPVAAAPVAAAPVAVAPTTVAPTTAEPTTAEPTTSAPAGSSSADSSSAGDSLAADVATAKGSTTLSWTPPTMNEDGTPLDLTGYRIYWGLAADNLTDSVTLGPGLTRYVVEQLKPARYYFVATALSKDGESEPSNVFAMEVR
jgi:hypothetical protein